MNQQLKNLFGLAPAKLVLADGTEFFGHAYGKTGQAFGELVFTTGMTGYQETLTDPSYAGQILIQTAPHIGNTGVNDEDNESDKAWVNGYVLRDPSPNHSNFRSEDSLLDFLEKHDIVSIQGIDTRALVLHIREQGSINAGIFSGEAFDLSLEQQLALVTAHPTMTGSNLTSEVSTKKAYTLTSSTDKSVATVGVLDLGIKRSTLTFLQKQGFDLIVFPHDVTIVDIENAQVDAVFYSNGPGDPESQQPQIELLQNILRKQIPFFGICFGNQLLGRALGLETYKLPFGHRGINQPVLDKSTGKIEITAQNHGFAVEADINNNLTSSTGFGTFEVSHYSLNDFVVEGIRCLDVPAFSVQYHPESAAGPHDSTHLFKEFYDLVLSKKA